MALNKIYNIHKTKNGYDLKNLVLTEDKLHLVGKAEVVNTTEDKEKEATYVNLKWVINREEKIAVCTNGNSAYDISLEGKFIPGLPVVEKEKRNFYTFHKNAWHCKIYKWVFGKNPHEVHPTMCPYFWIMVAVFFLFPLVFLIKMTGKGGVKFMESCTTYSRRMKDKREAAYNLKCREFSETMTDESAYYFTKTKLWKKYEYRIDYEVRSHIQSASNRWYWHLEDIKDEAKRLERERKDLEEERKWEMEQQRKIVKEQTVALREKRVKALKESKTSKIIGIILVLVVLYYTVWGVSVVSIAFYHWVRWDWVGYSILALIGLVLVGFVSYLLFRYIIIPLFKFLRVKASKINPPKVNLKPIGRGTRKSFRFIGKMLEFIWRFIRPIGRTIASGFVYMFDFYKMVKDMIYNTYKKNCPTITWKDPA